MREKKKYSTGLRALEPSDAEWMYEAENEPSAFLYSSNIAPLSLSLIKDYAENYEADPIKTGQLRLAGYLTENKARPVAILDLVEIDFINQRAAVGIWVLPLFRHKGIATELLDQLCKYCHQRLGLKTLWADIEESNTGSKRLFEKVGFALKGVFPYWFRHGDRFENCCRYVKTLHS